MIRSALVALLTALALVTLNGCEDKPKADYEAFKKRTQSLRDQVCLPASDRPSRLVDLRGFWLLNAKLSTGTLVALRIEMSADTWPEQLEEGETFTFNASIWLAESDPTSEPLVVVDPPPRVDWRGHFTLTADPLVLELSSGPVEAVVNLESISQDGNAFCGDATGDVVQPLTISLEGSRFGALRDDDLSLNIEDVPRNCGCDEDDEEEMGGESMGGMTIEGPERPDLPSLAREDSGSADITGHWLINIKLPVPLPLKLWASLVYTPPSDPPIEGAEGGVVDGVLRRQLDPINAEPIARFSSAINRDGVFEVWMPSFSLMGAIPVSGDLLIGGVIVPSAQEDRSTYWCGLAGGVARTTLLPDDIDLTGTTLYASPWLPGSADITGQLNACPN